MSRPQPHPHHHLHPHPDSMDSSAAKDLDDFDALLRAHEQPIDTTPVGDSYTGHYSNAPPQVSERLNLMKSGESIKKSVLKF
jgi:hypothetical protein